MKKFFVHCRCINVCMTTNLKLTAMKKMFLLLAVMLTGFTSMAVAQKGKVGDNPIEGVWQYVEEVTRADGKTIFIGKQIYKTITADNQYYVMLGVNIPVKSSETENAKISTLTFMTQQGEIEMTSENTYLEYINNHYLDKNLNNTISNLKFRFNADNPNILYIEYNIDGDNSWVSEVWMRVMPYGAK